MLAEALHHSYVTHFGICLRRPQLCFCKKIIKTRAATSSTLADCNKMYRQLFDNRLFVSVIFEEIMSNM